MMAIKTDRLQKGKQDIGSALEGLTQDEETKQHVPSVSKRRRVRVMNVPIDAITRHSDVQTRSSELDPDHVEEDARFIKSIEKHGVITPIKLRPLEDGEFQLVVGHRRYAACKHLEIKTIPAVIADSDEDAEELILQTVIENAHRKDLTDVEKAALVLELSERGLTQRQIAEEMNCSQGQVSLLTKLENTDSDILELVQDGAIGAYSASEIMALTKEKRNTVIQGVRKGLSVKDAIQVAEAQVARDEANVSDSAEAGNEESQNTQKDTDQDQQAKDETGKGAAPTKAKGDVHLAQILSDPDTRQKIVDFAKTKTVYKYALAALARSNGSYEGGLAVYEATPAVVLIKLNQAMLANAKLAIILSIDETVISNDEATKLVTCVFTDEKVKNNR